MDNKKLVRQFLDMLMVKNGIGNVRLIWIKYLKGEQKKNVSKMQKNIVQEKNGKKIV
jgi:hypothetical protein